MSNKAKPIRFGDGTLTFEEQLERLINRYSKENGSNTPDFILAKYMSECLDIFNDYVMQRERWYGRKSKKIKKKIHAR